MAHEKIMMRILLSSPSDMDEERALITSIVDEINATNKETPYGIELYKWETDTDPSLTLEDGQKSIDETFDYIHADLLIGMFFKRAGLGTKHEIDEAIKVKKQYGFPEIKLYFKKVTTKLGEATSEEIENFRRIKELKDLYYPQGICGKLKDMDGIEKEFRKHIQRAFDRFKHLYAKSNTYIPDVNNNHINSYKLFYFRTAAKKITIKELSKETGISVAKIRKYEKMIYSQNNIKLYPQCTYNDLKKLEDTLGIGIGGLSIKKSDKELEMHYDYYRSNKGLNTGNKISTTSKAKYKIVIFDFDGTLADPNSLKTTWQRLWLSLGYDLAICKNLHSRFDKKEITHQEWCDLTAQYFVTRGMNKSNLMSVVDGITKIDGLHETLKKLYESGIQLYVVSGSVREIIDEVLGDDVKFFNDISANRFIFNEDEQLTRIEGTDFDFEGKAEYIRNLSDKLAIPAKEILFVGNSFNDAHVYKSGARTLCVNPTLTNSHNRKYWHDTIDEMKNLAEILKYCDL